MRLEQLLVAKGMVGAADVERAAERGRSHGGELAENLVALKLVTPEQIVALQPQSRPAMPATAEDTEVTRSTLIAMLLKALHRAGADNTPALAELLCLPGNVIANLVEESVERKLLKVTGSNRGGAIPVLTYSLTSAGRNAVADALDRNQYIGPVPVSLQAYRDRVAMQRLSNEQVEASALGDAFADLVLTDDLKQRVGPAVNAGRSILLFGPPGNGKSSIARRVNRVFSDVIYIPHCIEVSGQIVKIFDPKIHEEVGRAGSQDAPDMVIRRDDFDRRWVACRRPLVITGGEFTLDMLDLRHNEQTNFYEAPLHIKAVGGVFVIDDFGRQYVRPKDLLNRWMIPLEEKIDYLKLSSGATFSVPFDELVIFCTNLAPEDLTDAAFLRRIPYKIRLGAPSLERYREIFIRAATLRRLPFDEAVFGWLVDELQSRRHSPLACYQPRFIVDHVVDACNFAKRSPEMSEALVATALDNLYTNAPEA
jgi:predicted ATPase with chaperone activity